MQEFIELVSFKAKAGVTPAQVISAAEEVNLFLQNQHGFISRHLGQTEDGTWHDILFWRSRQHLMTAMKKVVSSPHCGAFFELIEEASDSMALFPSLMKMPL